MKNYNITVEGDRILSMVSVNDPYVWHEYSLIKPDSSGEYIISIADDNADNILYYTTVASWHSGLETWIKDNEVITDSIVKYWAKLPSPVKPCNSADEFRR